MAVAGSGADASVVAVVVVGALEAELSSAVASPWVDVVLLRAAAEA